MAGTEIPPRRKGIHYVGICVALIGVVLFASVLLPSFLSLGDDTAPEAPGGSRGLRAFFGLALLVAGGVLLRVASRGFAGSGIIIDPEKAREDIQPRSRMAGGIARDALDEAGVDPAGLKGDPKTPFNEKLRRLHQLREDGILTEEEYAREKAELLEKN